MRYFLTLAVLLIVVGCENQNPAPRGDSLLLGEVAFPAASKRMSADALEGEALFVSPANNASQVEPRSKKVTKTGNLTFKTDDTKKTYSDLQALLNGFDAYIENENQSNDSYRINYSVNLRVASSEFDSLMNRLSGLSNDVEQKSTRIQDVTERYYDLESRIKNKKELEKRYLDILKRATKVSDILNIERNLNTVRTEIEQAEGQFNYLSKQIGYSSIYLNFYEKLPFVSTEDKPGFLKRILAGLERGWQGILSFIITLVSIWPVVLVTPVVIYFFMRWRSSKKRYDD